MEMDEENFDLVLPEHPPQQHSFLLRCMETRRQTDAQQEQTSGWLFSLQNPKTNEVYSFRDLAGLMAFLQSVLGEVIEEQDK